MEIVRQRNHLKTMNCVTAKSPKTMNVLSSSGLQRKQGATSEERCEREEQVQIRYIRTAVLNLCSADLWHLPGGPQSRSVAFT